MSDGLPSPGSPNFLAKVREFALVGLGLTQDRSAAFVRLRDLQKAGIVIASPTYLNTGQGTPISGPGTSVGAPEADLSPPPAPSGFVATAGITQILFETAAPTYSQGHGHARTRIYAANVTGPLPTFSDAVLYTDFPGNVGVAPFDPASSLRLWATWVSVDGVESTPTGGTNGVAAATGLLEDQHIANMVVGKLLAGTLAVGQYMQSPDYVAGTSGWRLGSLVGGAAFFEMRGNAVFNGTIYAAAGTIGGSTIGANYMRSTTYALNSTGWNLQSDGTGQIGGLQIGSNFIQSSNYAAGSAGFRWNYDGSLYGNNVSLRGVINGGGFTGYAWPPAGQTGFHLSATGLLLGNANDGRYIAIEAGGNIYAPQFSIVNGAATFSGNLSGASGTFSGSLTAQVVNTANIVGAAVTSTYAAYGGTSPGVALTANAGDRSIVVFVYTGTYIDSGTSAEVIAKANLYVNGSVVAAFTGNGVHVIDSPSGSYSIYINYVSPSSTDGRVVALHTKR